MEDTAHGRTAFTAVLLLDRRKKQPGNGASITAVAVDPSCQRLYVGLEDGWLEEHTILRTATGVAASLAARKHAAKKAILGIHALPDQGLVVLLSEDGLVQLLDCESLEGRLLPVRHALATCVATPPGHFARLAVATKPSSRAMRFLVYELPPSSSSSSSSSSSGLTTGGGHPHAPQLLAQAEVPDSSTAVHGMGWVGGHLAVCCGVRYLLVAPFDPPSKPARGVFGGAEGQWRELFSVPAELAYWPAMLTTMPDLGRALLVVGPAGIIVDAGGNPVGSALRLEGLGATPRALAAAGPFLLLVSEAGIHVFDRQSGGEVQRLAFAADLRPLPAQPLFAAASGDGAAFSAAGSAAGSGAGAGAGGSSRGGSSSSSSGGGGCVAVAGRRVVWLCLPVSPADQARELLAQRDYEAALELIEGGLAQGAAWAQAAAAQAALLLLHECRVEEAVRCLEQCSPATFQPSQLFPLFPSYTAPWAHQVPTHQRYWGLAAPLPSLESLIDSKLRGGQRQQEGGGSAGGSSGWRTPPRADAQLASSSSRSSSLFALDASSGGGASPATSPPSAGRHSGHSGHSSSQQQPPSKGPLYGKQQEGASPPAAAAAAAAAEAEPGRQAPQNGATQQLPGTTGEQVFSKQRQQEDLARQWLQRQAWESLAQYLFRVRMLEGVTCLPGVDTLLLLLLADLGDARQVAAFCAVPSQASVPSVQPRLQAEQWHHALATLHAARGHADVALHMWRQVADGQLAAPSDPLLQAAERREAIESAAALLRDPSACPESTLVGYIPWLLAASQPAALEVLTARSLTPAAVLPLLPDESDVRWQYLAHLVGMDSAAGTAGTAGGDPALHTELATQLVAAIFRAGPDLRAAAPPGSSACAARSLGISRRASEGSTGAGSNGSSSMVPRVGSGQGRRRLSRTSTAALVSGGSLEPWPGATLVQAMRLRLRGHLQQSSFYNADAVLASLRGTGLVEELVVVHSKVGDHVAAMRLLALTLHDVAAAVAYARANLAPGDYRALLHLVLEPGPGLEPRWEDACYLITALGDHLDPQEVLQALPAGMPLASAAGVLGPMLRDRLHRRRQGVMVKNLHRARLAVAAGAICDAQSQHVTVGEDRACPHCHLRLGGKVFVVLQPCMVPPDGGGGASAAAAAAAAGNSSGRPGRGAGGGGEGGTGGGTGPASVQQQQKDEAGEVEALRPPGEDRLLAAAQRQQHMAEAGQEPQVLCYACYRRLFPQAAAGGGAAGGAGTAGAEALTQSTVILTHQ